MSRVIEDHCVSCGQPCLGRSCPYRDVPVYYCDECGDNNARYRIDEDDLCKDCAERRIQEVFDDLTLSEKADIVEVDFSEIGE